MPIDELPIDAGEASLITDDVPPAPIDDVPPANKAADAAPVEATARLDSVDVLRGVALLGILAMNIVHFSWPYVVYSNPTAAPGYGWGDIALWMVNHVVFEEKMMTIFSMLFGAGLVLMSERADVRGAPLGRFYYRRVGILLGIGLIHAYLIWSGDILVPYALCGLFLFPFRRMSATTLIVIGVLLLGLAIPGWLLGRGFLRRGQEVTARVEAQLAADETPSEQDRKIHDDWIRDMGRLSHTAEEFDKELRAYRGGYLANFRERAGDSAKMDTQAFFFALWWMVGGRMLLGMGLMKCGVFSAVRSTAFYRRLALLGYGVGLPLMICDIAIDWYYDFFTRNGLSYFTGGWWLIQELGSPIMALGHVAMVMLFYKSGAWPWLTRRLGAVGRMALTNYLLTSIVCTALFYGYGFGLYARLHRPALYLVVLAVWAIQLAVSLPWLTYFRFGPAEWAWRSLTYGRRQPFRREAPIGS